MQYATCNNAISLWYNQMSMRYWLFCRWIVPAQVYDQCIYFISSRYDTVCLDMFELAKRHLILTVDTFFYCCERKKNLDAFSIGTTLISMNALATLAMRTQLVIIQWDLTFMHVILAILEMDLTAQVCIWFNFLSCNHSLYRIFK